MTLVSRLVCLAAVSAAVLGTARDAAARQPGSQLLGAPTAVPAPMPPAGGQVVAAPVIAAPAAPIGYPGAYGCAGCGFGGGGNLPPRACFGPSVAPTEFGGRVSTGTPAP